MDGCDLVRLSASSPRCWQRARRWLPASSLPRSCGQPRRQSSPWATVSSSSRRWRSSNWAISVFGTNDKSALLTGIYLSLVLFAVLVGLLAARSPPLVSLASPYLVQSGSTARRRRRVHHSADVIPSIVAGVVGAAHLAGLLSGDRTARRPGRSVGVKSQASPAGRQRGRGICRARHLPWPVLAARAQSDPGPKRAHAAHPGVARAADWPQAPISARERCRS